MEKAMEWRAMTVSEKDWNKKGLDPKGDKLESSKPGGIASFAIPPGLTCPKAGSCKNHCFALTGHTAYVQMVRDTHAAALGLSERDDFVTKMNEQIQKKFKNSKSPNPQNPYRIHAWGDFYSNKYAQKWVDIIKSNPNVWFYAYTKSFTMPAIKQLRKDINSGKIKNARIIQSLNGKDDKYINPKEPIAVVFKSRGDMDAWNKGVNSVSADEYAKYKANRLSELGKKSELDPYEKKEIRKLKKEKPEKREQAYANLVKLLKSIGVTPQTGKFVECSDNDLVAADPKNKRVGIVEHGELHQPYGPQIQDIEKEITSSIMEDISGIGCEHMHSIN
jgi:hypothetical protein